MKVGLIDVGGGMRGAYSTGILEYCLENEINFDCCIGVSAGSSNVMSFLAKQKQRNVRYYFKYAFRKEYTGIRCLLRTGSYLNLNYIYGELANTGGEDPLDYETLMKNPAEMFIVAEECVSGKTKYFTKKDISKDNYRILAASCNIPIINRPVKIDGIAYYDGGFADPVPIQKALEEGCDKVVLILTRPVNTLRSPTRDRIFASLLRLRFPNAARGLANRADNYNNSVKLAKELQEEGKVLILSPKDMYGMDTLTKNLESMKKLYEEGRKDAEKIKDWLKIGRIEDVKI